MIYYILLLIEEEEKALAPGGFEPGTSRCRDCRSNHFATTTATGVVTVASLWKWLECFHALKFLFLSEKLDSEKSLEGVKWSKSFLTRRLSVTKRYFNRPWVDVSSWSCDSLIKRRRRRQRRWKVKETFFQINLKSLVSMTSSPRSFWHKMSKTISQQDFIWQVLEIKAKTSH